MIKITFEIDGREVSPDQIGDALKKSLFETVAVKIQEALASARCPEHGKTPTVKVKGSTLDDLSMEVHGCCQALIDASVAKLK